MELQCGQCGLCLCLYSVYLCYRVPMHGLISVLCKKGFFLPAVHLFCQGRVSLNTNCATMCANIHDFKRPTLGPYTFNVNRLIWRKTNKVMQDLPCSFHLTKICGQTQRDLTPWLLVWPGTSSRRGLSYLSSWSWSIILVYLWLLCERTK